MNKKSVNLICSHQICAAHQLIRADWSEAKNREVYGKCAQIHGHQYTLQLILTGELDDETGMLINAFDVEKIMKPFIERFFDHKFLNKDVPFFHEKQPTAEWIAIWVYQELQNKFPPHVTLKKVRIYEMPELAVEYPEA